MVSNLPLCGVFRQIVVLSLYPTNCGLLIFCPSTMTMPLKLSGVSSAFTPKSFTFVNCTTSFVVYAGTSSRLFTSSYCLPSTVTYSVFGVGGTFATATHFLPFHFILKVSATFTATLPLWTTAPFLIVRILPLCGILKQIVSVFGYPTTVTVLELILLPSKSNTPLNVSGVSSLSNPKL